MAKVAVCPKCLAADGFAERDILQAMAFFTAKVAEDGAVEIAWTGESDIDWDSQRLDPAARRAPYQCKSCGACFRRFRVVDARCLEGMRARRRLTG